MPRGVIEYVNPHFTPVTGYSAAEAVGRTPAILRSGQNPPSTYRDLWVTIGSGRPWTGELHNRRKDGGLYWSLMTISPIRSPTGEITHFVGVGEDVTELKEAHARAERLAL
jgi:PAS domain S-box-containing protein